MDKDFLETILNYALEYIQQAIEISYEEYIDYVEHVDYGGDVKNPYFKGEVHGNPLYIRKMKNDLAKITNIMHENGFHYDLPISLRS